MSVLKTIDLGVARTVFRGNWNATTQYEFLNTVIHNNALWQACALNIPVGDEPAAAALEGMSASGSWVRLGVQSGGSGAGENGATFTPSVADGYLSWTNDKGLPNPAPVYIKGPQGEQGPIGPQGPKGDKGDPGTGDATPLYLLPAGGTPLLQSTINTEDCTFITGIDHTAYFCNVHIVLEASSYSGDYYEAPIEGENSNSLHLRTILHVPYREGGMTVLFLTPHAEIDPKNTQRLLAFTYEEKYTPPTNGSRIELFITPESMVSYTLASHIIKLDGTLYTGAIQLDTNKELLVFDALTLATGNGAIYARNAL